MLTVDKTDADLDDRPNKLNPNDMLIAEYNYIANTASQSNEDRARIATLYFVTLGTLVAAVFSASTEPQNAAIEEGIRIAFVTIFASLSVHSLLTILQLIRLRSAWIESATAMNVIKKYYVDHAEYPQLDSAFRWKSETIPSRFKPNSISAIIAFQVAVLGGIAFGSGVYFYMLGCRPQWFACGSVGWIQVISSGVLFWIVQLLVYWLRLR